ncbi:MAG TPA: hypothetical protein VFB55_04735, partial [Verrucomicrobiae bacterium]|nr:hypothetical protein [Verrucomicrobiae bacterium]
MKRLSVAPASLSFFGFALNGSSEISGLAPKRRRQNAKVPRPAQKDCAGLSRRARQLPRSLAIIQPLS